jgi:hypothetical protein
MHTTKNPLEGNSISVSIVKIEIQQKGSYEKYWEFLSCGNIGRFDDIDEKT